MAYTYAILGSGMQGTAAAFDLAKHGDAARILMGDQDLATAERNAARVNTLVGKAVCEPVFVDALQETSLRGFLSPVDVVLSCVPYWMHPLVAPIAINTVTSMVDLGGDTEVTLKTLALDDAAKAAKVSIVPDTGLAPGLVNSLATYLMSQFDEVLDVRLYCGGLPQNPKPPFNYKLVFNVEGLIAEYTDPAFAIRDYKIARPDPLTDIERLEWEGLGEMEAFVTSGGTSTAPLTFEGKVRTYEYKTIRFPGHCERMRLFSDFGFWSQEPIEVDGHRVRPRELWHRIMAERLRDDEDKDQVLVRAVVTGKKDGKEREMRIEIHDRYDEATGFSAMERMTGFPAAIVAAEIARGAVERGCVRYELAVPGERVVAGLRERGIPMRESGN